MFFIWYQDKLGKIAAQMPKYNTKKGELDGGLYQNH